MGRSPQGNTDWARVDAMTEEELDASIANDPDWAKFKDIDWSDAVFVMPPKKKAISIRVDEDVLDFQARGRRLSAAHQCGAALLHGANVETEEAGVKPAEEIRFSSFRGARSASPESIRPEC
jgi:uncharacterized protein (DUF4415 family)